MHDFEELDHYALLGVSRSASVEEIKRAYRQQVNRYHPDRFVSAPANEQAYASARTQRINEAYRVLSNFDYRNAYNRGQAIPSAARQPGTRGRSAVETTRAAPRRPAAPRDHQAELYEQARDHLKAERHMQAAATLRELQQINPFYRDSATLLAQAEAALQGDKPAAAPPPPAAESFPQPAAPPRRRHALLWLSGLGGTALVLVLLLVSFSFLQAPAASGPAPTTAPAVVEQEETVPTASEEAATAAPAVPAAEATATPGEDTAAATATSATSEEDTVAAAATATPPPEPTITPPPPEPTITPPPPTATAPAAQPERGTLLFSDTFNLDLPGGQGWANQQGIGWSVGYVDSVYQITTQPGLSNIWSYRTAFEAGENFSLGADVQVINGSAGLIFRFLDSSNYLAFLIDQETGGYLFEQTSGGVRQVLAEGESEAINLGETAINRLVVRLNGPRTRVFINQQEVADATTEGTALTNQYGFVVNGPADGARAIFDNVEIRTLE